MGATTVSDPVGRTHRQSDYTHQFTLLSQQVKATGLLRRRYGYYWTKMTATVLALTSVAVGVVWLGNSWFQLLMAGTLAVVFAQFAFIGHDAAHRQIFRSGKANEWAGLIQGTLFGGLSSGWWMGKHSRHHANPNKERHDPDIAPGLVAFTPAAVLAKTGIAAHIIRRQGYYLFPLLLLEGLNLHVKSVRRVVARQEIKRRWWEIAFLTIRLGGYVSAILLLMPPGKAAAFLGLQLGLYGLYLGGAFVPNHTGMPIVPATMKLDFLRRQVLMSRNVRGGWFTHFVLGGLNYQIEHHLFPSMPRPNLRRAQPIVRAYCDMHNVAYTEKSLAASYGIVVRYLNSVEHAAHDPFGCPLAAQLRAPS